MLVESLESRALLSHPSIVGWWEGDFSRAGAVEVKLKQDGGRLWGRLIDDEGLRFAVKGSVDRAGAVALRLTHRDRVVKVWGRVKDWGPVEVIAGRWRVKGTRRVDSFSLSRVVL